MEILTNLRDDSLNRVIDGLSHLIACAKTIKHEEENIRRFSEHMICVREIINMLQSMQSRGQFSHNNTAAELLLKLEIAVNDARKAIEGYKSKGPLLYIFYSSSVFSKLNESSKEIANVLILLSQTQILTAVDINSNLDAIIHSLKSMELKFVENNNAIYSKLDQYISENSGNRQHTDQGLFQHPQAEGATSSKSVEMESGKSINKAYQFIQRLACFSPEMSSSTQRESTVDEIASAPNIFFYCPLTMKPMEDPVTVSCNHSYERKAIEEYFRSGKKTCLLCEKELVSSTSGDLELTPNPTLLGSISEWKLRNAKKKLRDAVARITLDNLESTNRALNDLIAVMNEMPSCISEATEISCKLVRKLGELLKNGAANTDGVLCCILLIVRFSRENREIIGTRGVIKCLLKLSNFEPIVVEILLELSRNDNFAQKVSNIPIFIPIMLSLLDNPDSCLVENVLAVLKNISHSYNNTIFMAKAGYFTPFLDEFNAQGTSEGRRAFMAENLAQMQLTEIAANNLNNEHFIIHLTMMLLSSSPGIQFASLKCIKKLITFNGIKISFLSTVRTIPALLCILMDTTSEKQSKKEAFEVLFSLIKTRQPFNLELTPNPTLLDTISEWKSISAEKNAKKRLGDVAERITLDDMVSTNRALNDPIAVMKEMPNCISEATGSSCKLVRKLAVLLKKGTGNTGWVLCCLLIIARFSHENKKIMGTQGVIKCLLKLSKTEPVAVEILLELSRIDKIAQKILEMNNSIPILVSLLDNPNSCSAENVFVVLKNLSHNNNNTIFLAESGYLTPFLDEFNAQGTSEERRAFMAEKLAHIQLTETVANNLNNEHFIIHLSMMLLCSSPGSQFASLKCIKRLITFKGINISFLSTVSTIAALLYILTDTTSEQQYKKEAFEVLSSLIKMSHPLNQQSYPGLQRIYSSYNIHNLLEQIKDSTPNDQLSLLRLLLAMFQKSDTARNEIISDQKAMSHLFSAVRLNVNDEVRFNALKLVYCITGNHPSDIPLPPHEKETTLSSIITILTDQSCIDEEVSIAANIISHLPRGDKSIDEMLQNSAVLKAIHSLISHANKQPNDFSENALGALLRCINKSNSGFLVPVSKLEPLLVQMLSTGASPLVKQRAAMILAYLAQCAPDSSHSRRPSWPNLSSTHCAVHEACSLQRITCLIKAGAVGPLVDMVDIINPDASKEALIALDTLFDTGNMEPSASQYLVDKVADIIVENKGAAPILEVLERGLLPLKKAALELFGKIYKRPGITRKELDRYKAILVYQHNEDDEFKQKVKTQLEELEFHSRLCL